jgi:hypothetical protein
MEVPASANAYLPKEEMENANTILVSKVDRIEAYKPYVIITTKDMTFSTQVETAVPVASNIITQVKTANYAMTGTLKALSAEEVEKGHMYLLGENNRWYQGSQQTLPPYHAYMQATTANMPSIVQMITKEQEEVVAIADGSYTQFENLEERVVGTLSYTRTLNNTWNALYVPFQVKLTEKFLANYDIAYINDVRSYDRDDDGELDDWDVEIIKIKKLNKKLEANYPYVIRPKNDEAVNLNIIQRYETLYSTAPEYLKEVTCLSAYKEYAVKGVYAKTVSADLDNGNYVYAIYKNGQW